MVPSRPVDEYRKLGSSSRASELPSFPLLLDLVRRGDLRLVVLERAVAVAARMARDGDRRAAEVVRVVRFGELVALPGRWILHARTVALCVRRVRRVHLDFYRVVAGRNDRLVVAAVEDEVLAAELEDVGVGPARAHALEAVARRGAAAAVGPGAVTI